MQFCIEFCKTLQNLSHPPGKRQGLLHCWVLVNFDRRCIPVGLPFTYARACKTRITKGSSRVEYIRQRIADES